MSEISTILEKAANEIIDEIGVGHPEHIYSRCLKIYLDSHNISNQREREVLIRYRGHVLGWFRPDFETADYVIELKVCNSMKSEFEAQIERYMKQTKKSGILLIFPKTRNFKPIVNQFKISSNIKCVKMYSKSVAKPKKAISTSKLDKIAENTSASTTTPSLGTCWMGSP